MFNIGAFESNDDRNLNSNRFSGLDYSRRDDIAAHDPAEDINKDSFHVLVRQQNAKGVLHLLGGCASTNIQKVCRTAAGKFDDVHRGHRQARAVHHACDVAVELDVIQAELAGLDFQGIFFVEIAQFLDVLVAIKRVVIEVHFGIEGVDLVITGHEERIDLRKRCIRIFKCLV